MALPDGGRMVSYGDITALRRVERDLREGEERFRRLASATREGVLVHDGDVIIDANDAALALLDRTLPDLVGRSAERLIAPADYAALRDTLRLRQDPSIARRGSCGPTAAASCARCPSASLPTGDASTGILTFYDITGYRWIEDQLRAARQRAEAESRAGSDFLAILGKGVRSSLRGTLDLDPPSVGRPVDGRAARACPGDPEIGPDHKRHAGRQWRILPASRGRAADRRQRFRPDRSGRRRGGSAGGPGHGERHRSGFVGGGGCSPYRARRRRTAAPGAHDADRQCRQVHRTGRRFAEPDRFPGPTAAP